MLEIPSCCYSEDIHDDAGSTAADQRPLLVVTSWGGDGEEVFLSSCDRRLFFVVSSRYL
jgi:hypothetical protein